MKKLKLNKRSKTKNEKKKQEDKVINELEENKLDKILLLRFSPPLKICMISRRTARRT